MSNSNLKFIDLFAGIGGFHLALNSLGHTCVFASEINPDLASLYEKNFNMPVDRDITKMDVSKIPEFDILCAGFPCQPFSKAGKQNGLKDKRNGFLFDKIVEILEFHKPKYLILENVRNLIKHDNENTWLYIQEKLEKQLGYSIDKHIYSPHNFGIPQHRERLFIVGSKDNLDHFTWMEPSTNTTNIYGYLDKTPVDALYLEEEKVQVLKVWQEFILRIPKEDPLPTFPIWSMEFGATYPYEDYTPYYADVEKLQKTKGIFGKSLKGMSKKQILENLPTYSLTQQKDFPSWKKNYIRHNRTFYKKYKKLIDPVLKDIKKFKIASWQKFEWNVGSGPRDLYQYLIQFRGSGVRVKKTDYFPSLVTVTTQIPIIGWEKRYITTTEGARLQSIDGISLPEKKSVCFRALGNAVNVEIVKLIAKRLITECK